MLPIKIKLPENFLEEENRNGTIVSKQMKEIWAVELDLLSELQRVFKKYDIKYFSYAGTTLGAVRHNGFIPWDDDIDIIVSRENFTKLCKVAKKEFKAPYFFQTEETDPGCCIGMAKLRNSNTTGILQSHENRAFSFNQGIFVDVFVFDNIPDDMDERKVFFDTLSDTKKKALIFRNRFHSNKDELKTAKGKIKRIFEKFIRFFNIKNPYYKKLYSLCQKYDSTETKYVQDVFNFPDIWKCSSTECYKESIMQPFEFLEIPVSKQYDLYLTEFFGDWKTPKKLPPEHGFGTIFDTKKSYKDYLKEHK